MKVLIFSITLFALYSCQAPRPKDLGVKEAEGEKILPKCPESPNCINSHFGGDKDHYLAPLKYETTKDQAKELLLKVIARNPSAKIVTNNSDYLHVEYTSSLFKFVDDVEFHFYKEKLIHFRSASRTGYSDLGANRKRMSQISFYFYQNNM